jgi:hypothetical protein
VATPEIVSKISLQVHQKVNQGALHVSTQPVKSSEPIIEVALAALKINNDELSSRKGVTQNDVSIIHEQFTAAYEPHTRTESWSAQGPERNLI